MDHITSQDIVKSFPETLPSVGTISRTIRKYLPKSPSLIDLPSPGENSRGIQQLRRQDILSFVLYVISNDIRLPADPTGARFYDWLKQIGSWQVLRSISVSRHTSTDVFHEHMFPMAVMANDLQVVNCLLRLSINPNRRSCYYGGTDQHPYRFLDMRYALTPLEFACISGRLQLGHSLIRHGSTLQEASSGPLRSTLVLAIFGWAPCRYKSTGISPVGNGAADQDAQLLAFVKALVALGAKIEVQPEAVHENYRNWDLKHELVAFTPLTAASKFHSESVVSYLLENAANVELWTGHGTSALYECLRHPCGPDSLALPTVRLLLPFSTVPIKYSYSKKFDLLAITIEEQKETECADIVSLLLLSGVIPTMKSVEASLIRCPDMETFRHIRQAGGNVGPYAMELVMEKFRQGDQRWFNVVLETCRPVESRLGLLRQAINKTKYVGSSFLPLLGYLEPLENYPFRQLVDFFSVLCPRASVELVLQVGSGINIMDVLGAMDGPVVCDAIHHENIDMVHFLIGIGLDVNQVTKDNSTALTAAVRAGADMSLLRRLRRAGAELSVRRPEPPYMESCPANSLVTAAEAGDTSAIDYLIGEGAHINSRGESCCARVWKGHSALNGISVSVGVTPLAAAILAKRRHVIPYLFERGACVNDNLGSGISPLAAAVLADDYQIFQDLLIQNEENTLDQAAARLLGSFVPECCEKPELILAPWLRAISQRQPLLTSYEITVVKKLLSAAFMILSWYHMHSEAHCLVQAVVESRAIQAICAAEKIEQRGCLPYPSHVLFGNDANPEMSADLLAIFLGEVTDFNGMIWMGDVKPVCALRYAVLHAPIEVVRLLLDAGAEDTGDGPVDPRESGTLLQITALDSDERMLKLLLDYAFDPDAVSLTEKQTPLQIAAEQGDLSIVKLLLDYKANVNSRSWEDGGSALQNAVMGGFTEIAQLLIHHGANVNAPPYPRRGATALQYAAIWGYAEIAELLIEKGADVNAPAAEKDGRTALEGAAEHGRIDMIVLLINAGARLIGDGHEAFERALQRATKDGRHAIRRFLEERLKESL